MGEVERFPAARSGKMFRRISACFLIASLASPCAVKARRTTRRRPRLRRSRATWNADSPSPRFPLGRASTGGGWRVTSIVRELPGIWRR